jgi:hypothetical protein
MWESCAVELRVRLPKPVADEVEKVQRSDPEMLSRMLTYAVARKSIFDHLSTRREDSAVEPGEDSRVDERDR